VGQWGAGIGWKWVRADFLPRPDIFRTQGYIKKKVNALARTRARDTKRILENPHMTTIRGQLEHVNGTGPLKPG